MFIGQIRARTPSTTSVNSEDTLDEDVRRILNKYSKVITSSEDESEVCEARKSPQGEMVFFAQISTENSGHLLNKQPIHLCENNETGKILH